MPKAIGVRLRTTGEIIQVPIVEENKYDFKKGEIVLVDISEGTESGTIVFEINKDKVLTTKNKFLRKVSANDLEKLEEIIKEEKRYHEICLKKIQKYGLTMRLIGTSLSLDGRNLTFYFTAEGRIDFRNLLKDLVTTLKKMIRLQQVGPKDAAKLMGGFGPCGRPVCCTAFLSEMKSITMDLAREQNLEGVTSSKISGLCGKLMCCLDYESKMYQEMKKDLPKIGDKVKTKDGVGRVVSLNVFEKKVLVEMEDGKRVEEKYS